MKLVTQGDNLCFAGLLEERTGVPFPHFRYNLPLSGKLHLPTVLEVPSSSYTCCWFLSRRFSDVVVGEKFQFINNTTVSFLSLLDFALVFF
jgi:hypothetical protein